MVRKIMLHKNKLSLEEKFEWMFEKIITKFGTGAKIDAPKEFFFFKQKTAYEILA